MATNPKTIVLLQKACALHRFIRSSDTSNIVERPERLRAVHLGLSAAITRLQGMLSVIQSSSSHQGTVSPFSHPTPSDGSTEDLANALERMNISTACGATPVAPTPVEVIHSAATLDLLNHAAVKFIHGDIDGDVYLENLIHWSRESEKKVSEGKSEIPEGLSQGDLYLCGESIVAISSALATTCDAVDRVMSGLASRAFVAIRPPGHHCGEDTPSGFCFVNNVAVGAAHAHLRHGATRAVIFDIDLHHGNGTQSIVWQINEEAYRVQMEIEASNGLSPAAKNGPGLRIFYGSVHDILSYPCEDGKPELVQAASASIHGAHGQYIENIHLQKYSLEEDFWTKLYKNQYSRLFEKAEEFIKATGNGRDDTIVFVSCGFDASEHEHESMSRHGRKVPVSFYRRFAEDARRFADRYARGRLISVLEGGYSDRALMSGAMAHLVGLVDLDAISPGYHNLVREEWWGLDNLLKLEKAAKKRRGGRQSLPGKNSVEQWISDTLDVFNQMHAEEPISVRPTRTLRARDGQKSTTGGVSPAASPPRTRGKSKTKPAEFFLENSATEPSAPEREEGNISGDNQAKNKTLPRVVLKLGPHP